MSDKLTAKIGQDKKETFEQIRENSEHRYNAGALKEIIDILDQIDRRESRFNDADNKIEALRQLVEGDADEEHNYEPEGDYDPLETEEVKQILAESRYPVINPTHVIPESTPHNLSSKARLVVAMLRYEHDRVPRFLVGEYIDQVEGDRETIKEEVANELWDLVEHERPFATRPGPAAVDLFNTIKRVRNGFESESVITPNQSDLDSINRRYRRLCNSGWNHETLIEDIDREYGMLIEAVEEYNSNA